jgi:DNA-binding Xre family transcriptional regulator
MRGNPRNNAPEHRPINATPPKLAKQAEQPERTSASRFAKPKILVGETAAPIPKFAASRGAIPIAKQRDTLRAFMISRGLRPTAWARAAGVPSGELLGFLTGHVRAIAPASLEKLARAAKCAPDDLFA